MWCMGGRGSFVSCSKSEKQEGLQVGMAGEEDSPAPKSDEVFSSVCYLTSGSEVGTMCLTHFHSFLHA